MVLKSDISIKPYIIGKILHGTFAAIYTYLFLNCIPFLNLDLGFKYETHFEPSVLILISILAFILICLFTHKSKLNRKRI